MASIEQIVETINNTLLPLVKQILETQDSIKAELQQLRRIDHEYHKCVLRLDMIKPKCPTIDSETLELRSVISTEPSNIVRADTNTGFNTLSLLSTIQFAEDLQHGAGQADRVVNGPLDVATQDTSVQVDHTEAQATCHKMEASSAMVSAPDIQAYALAGSLLPNTTLLMSQSVGHFSQSLFNNIGNSKAAFAVPHLPTKLDLFVFASLAAMVDDIIAEVLPPAEPPPLHIAVQHG